jgi:hypothetical protein
MQRWCQRLPPDPEAAQLDARLALAASLIKKAADSPISSLFGFCG